LSAARHELGLVTRLKFCRLSAVALSSHSYIAKCVNDLEKMYFFFAIRLKLN
jgi:hypothetical protein